MPQSAVAGNNEAALEERPPAEEPDHLRSLTDDGAIEVEGKVLQALGGYPRPAKLGTYHCATTIARKDMSQSSKDEILPNADAVS